MMLKNDQLYIIDTQDTCIGPYFCDFATFIINLNVDSDQWKNYAKYFYEKINQVTKDSFEEFYRKVLLYGYLHVLKSSGTHLRYYRNNGRKLSLKQVYTNQLKIDY